MSSRRGVEMLTTMVVFSLGWMTSHSVEQCVPDLEDVFCELPEVVTAASTKTIRLKASHLVQGFEEVCETFPKGRFRTADGTCNHLFNLGAANRPPKRLLPNAYDDGVNEPRTRDALGDLLPSPTLVSRTIHPARPRFQNFTLMFMQWGQFIDHDITGFPITSVFFFFFFRECFPIRLTEEDSNIRFRGECMEFARSVAARDKHGKKIVPREQVNSVTSFIDASMVYGSSQELQNELRTSFNGQPQDKLRVTEGIDLLPDNGEENCIHRAGEFCFLAGDVRVNEHPGLMAIHTVFVRIHNEIVDGLRQVRPGDSREQIFQLARKIVGAIVQNVHYGEWLPLVLGRGTAGRYRLLTGFRSEYVPSLDPRIANAFSTAAFRFGHSLIPDAFRIGSRLVPLRDLFGRTAPLFDNFNDVLLSLVRTSTDTGVGNGAQSVDRFFSEEITGHLFESENTIVGGPSNGLDLIALNIQRGRDHGLPPYNAFRKFCGLPALKSFSDFDNTKLGVLYQRLYRSVDDIDLFSGIMSEPRRFGIVGETLACLLGNQFHALKFGDRFFFETSSPKEGFTDEQLNNIRNITMAHLCCQLKGVPGVPSRLFESVNPVSNPVVSCFDLRKRFINFKLWANFQDIFTFA
ncbi:myeloperoxidase-like [Babylonia areolata]|uniref:myeloperoxidase-like n=1 Tax=Babylonia areolata TaxID=304850 RepID=UPI003FCF56FD